MKNALIRHAMAIAAVLLATWALLVWHMNWMHQLENPESILALLRAIVCGLDLFAAICLPLVYGVAYLAVKIAQNLR